jgi:hypothetical protein
MLHEEIATPGLRYGWHIGLTCKWRQDDFIMIIWTRTGCELVHDKIEQLVEESDTTKKPGNIEGKSKLVSDYPERKLEGQMKEHI